MITQLKTFVFGVPFLLPIISYGQQKDSVRLLQEVMVEQSRLGNIAISRYTLKVDSLSLRLSFANSLADLLRKQGFGHLRAYGPGGVATASFRGTGSSHTAVLWNGVNISSPLLGLTDLSQVPMSFADDAVVQAGGASSIYGNGSIGGTIQLNNKARFGDGLKIVTQLSGGSFGTYFQNGEIKWSNKKFITSTKAFVSVANNDFEFINRSNFPVSVDKRTHNAMQQVGVLQQNYWKISHQHLINAKFWYQDNEYQVPALSSDSKPSLANQKDVFYRALVGWNFDSPNFEVSYQAAFINHELLYADPAINLVSKSNFRTAIQNAEINFLAMKKASATAGINYTWEEGITDNFGQLAPMRNRIALFSAYKWQPNVAWELASSFREEWVDGNANPIAPAITVKYKLPNGTSFYGSTSNNYRIPTFNDLFWIGAGGQSNPVLKTETSHSTEIGFAFLAKSISSNSKLEFKGAVYTNSVNDWIQWSPNNALWSPKNLKKVWSRGVEVQGQLQQSFNEINASFSFQYTFTKATNEDLYNSVNSNELHKQLFYTPMHEGSATVRVSAYGYSFTFNSSYTGSQFTDGDNNIFFANKEYLISNVWLNKTLSFHHFTGSVMAEVNNAFNIEYLSRPGYPMPGINYKFGITLQFNKPSKI
jgi:vitamin B12 transporter